MDRRSVMVVLAAGALARPLHAGEQLLLAPPPEWVEIRKLEIPARAVAEGDQPVRTVLVDNQMLLAPDQQSIYSALAITFLNPQGLAGGNISLAWSPETDELSVHKVLIHREGEVVDVLGSGQSFTVLRREQSLEGAMLDGVLTANMFPEGLEVGDTLELAYMITSDHPVLEGHTEGIAALNGAVDRPHLRIIWPQSTEVRLAKTPDLPEWQRSRQHGMEVAELTLSAVEPLLPPKGAPPRYNFQRVVQASNFADWGEVARIFVPLYAQASRIPDSGPLRDELEKIRAASDDPAQRAQSALALVQDRIRYVALAMGEAGLVPADAADTWARRYGDCKAKTALLIGLLQELGIAAEPVLVNSFAGDAVAERLPAVSMFNHVIVCADIGGREFWLDGTRSHDASLDRLQVPNFGWVLPVREQGAELINLVAPPLTEPAEDLVVRIDASGGIYAPAPAELELVLRGDAAVLINANLSALAPTARTAALENYWRDRYDFITPQGTTMAFDPATGELRLGLTGTALLDWDNGYYEIYGMRVGYRPDFTRAPGSDGKAPFAVSHPMFERTVQTVILPADFSDADSHGEQVEAIAGGSEYRRTVALADNVFTATRTARSIAPEFTAAEAAEAARTLTSLADKRLFLREPAHLDITAADVDALLARDINDALDLRDRGIKLLDANRFDEALSDLDKAIALDESDAWAWANRGIALVHLRQPAEAGQSLARALELDAVNFVALCGQGMLAVERQDFDDAIALFTRSFEGDPQSASTYIRRSEAHAGKQDFTAALADLDKAIELFPGNIVAQAMRTMMLAALDRRAESLAAAETLLIAHPDDPAVQTMASRLHFALGDDERSNEWLANTLANRETPVALMMRAARRPTDEASQKLADLDRALELAPDFVPVLVLRAKTLWMEDRLDAALADAERAITLNPAALDVYDTKAKVLLDQNRKSEAAKVAEALLAANPDPALAYHIASSIYWELGRDAQAKEMEARYEELRSPPP